VIPIGDENNGRRLTPVVNYAIIVLNALVFFYMLTLSDTQVEDFVLRWGAIPNKVAHGHQLYALLTSQFVHGGWAHIGFNMLFLWVFGDNIEDTLGHYKYPIFYLICGIVAGLTQVFIDTSSTVPLIGASGAIAGVLGAYIVLFPKGNVRTLIFLGIFVTIVLIPAWIMIGIWIFLQFISGIGSLGVAQQTGGVAFFAHIGGFITGMILVWIFRNKAAHQRQLAARKDTRAFQRISFGG